MDFYFVRHGATDYNREHRLQGQCDRSVIPGICDMPLNQQGRDEARVAADVLSGLVPVPSIVISSPLLRARQTAEIIATALGVQIEIVDGLREMFFGEQWEGIEMVEFKSHTFIPPLEYTDQQTGDRYLIRTGEELRRYHKSIEPAFNNLAHPGGETKEEACLRMVKALDECAEKFEGSQSGICIVSHSAILRFFLSSRKDYKGNCTLSTGEVVCLSYSVTTR